MLLSFITDIIPELKAEAGSRKAPDADGLNSKKPENLEKEHDATAQNEALRNITNGINNIETPHKPDINLSEEQINGDIPFEVKYKMLLERMQKERTERELKLKHYNEQLFNRTNIN